MSATRHMHASFVRVLWCTVVISCCLVHAYPVSGGEVTAANTTTRGSFKVLHAYWENDPQASVSSTIATQTNTILGSHADLVVITTPTVAASDDADDTLNVRTSTKDAGSVERLLAEYSLRAFHRVLFKVDAWEMVRETTLPTAVWTRLQSKSAAPRSFICTIVINTHDLIRQEARATNRSLVEIAQRLDSFCAPNDLVMLAFTGVLPDILADYLQARIPMNGAFVPRGMVESVVLGYDVRGFAGSAPSSSTDRLFFHAPRPPTAVRAAATTSVGSVAISLDLCLEEGCNESPKTKLPDSERTDTQGDEDSPASSSKKTGLVIVLSCIAFLAGCAAAFYVLVRKRFLFSSESRKSEKELTAHISYVLRI